MDKIAVNCKTQQEAEELMELYDKKGWKWGSGDSALRNNHRGEYEEETCYGFCDGFLYADIEFYEEDGYKIISFQEAKTILEGKQPTKKLTYEKTYRRSDGVIFEKGKIDGKAIKELEETIEKNNEENKRVESLLRAYRAFKF